jgi:hypothetical protein
MIDSPEPPLRAKPSGQSTVSLLRAAEICPSVSQQTRVFRISVTEKIRQPMPSAAIRRRTRPGRHRPHRPSVRGRTPERRVYVHLAQLGPHRLREGLRRGVAEAAREWSKRLDAACGGTDPLSVAPYPPKPGPPGPPGPAVSTAAILLVFSWARPAPVCLRSGAGLSKNRGHPSRRVERVTSVVVTVRRPGPGFWTGGPGPGPAFFRNRGRPRPSNTEANSAR